MPAPTSAAPSDELAAHRPALLGHCYRMLGHPQDAADAVQDTFARALRAREGFRSDGTLRAWLMRIATNVCLDALARKKRRRELPMGRPPGRPTGPIAFGVDDEWIAPIPDAWVVPPEASPFAVAATRQRVRLAFVAALQHLPPRQRAALLLTQVVGWTAAEAADALDTSVASVHSALQRARAKLAGAEGLDDPGAATPVDEAVVQRYVEAFERFDVTALTALLAEDVTFSMPPISLWLRGPADVAAFLRGPGAECEGSVMVPTRASGLPAFAQYRHGGATPWGLVVLEPRGGRIAAIHTFLSVDALFPLFELPVAGGWSKKDTAHR